MDEKQKDTNLIAALNARRKLKEAEERLVDKKKKEDEAKQTAKKKEEDRKKAEKEVANLKDEKKLLLKLAGIKTEGKSSRGHFSSTCFFDLLNMFDADNEDRPFKKKYNSLKSIEKIAQAVRDCTTYDIENDILCINGKLLREKVDTLLQEKEDLIKTAREKLDAEWAKVLADDIATSDTSAEKTVVDNTAGSE